MQLSTQERESYTLSPETITTAIQAVKVNGFVILESGLPKDFLQTLYDGYMVLFNKYMENPPETTFGNKHYRLDLPFRAPFSDPLVVANPLAMPIIEGLIGADCVCRYFASNTNMPGSQYQAVHSDIYPLFPETAIAPPAYHVVLNFSLVDTTLANGPVEIWPGGTHLNTIPRDQLEKLAPQMHSEMCEMPAGSILIRDGRMWHRGTLNKSDGPRPNVALVYQRHWLGADPRRTIGIPQATYDALPQNGQTYFRKENIGGPVDCELL